MMAYSKRALGLVLMVSVCIWAQAVCPMMLFSQSAEQCSRPAGVKTVSHGSHECCPGMRAKKEHQQCDRMKLTNWTMNMSCCSVERPPANTGKAVQPSVEIGVVGRTIPATMQIPHLSATLESENEGPPSRGVLQLKEDLRI